MSFFFRSGDSSDDSSDYSSDDNTVTKSAATKRFGAKTAATKRFQKKPTMDVDSDSDVSDASESEASESDSEARKKAEAAAAARKKAKKAAAEAEAKKKALMRRGTRSAADRKYDEMRATCKTMSNAVNIGDWVVASNEFEKLHRQATKAVESADAAPAFFLRTLLELESSVRDATDKEKESKKKVNATIGKALSSMKNKMKKANKPYEGVLGEFAANPVPASENEDEDDDVSGSDADSAASDSDDDSMFGSEDESEDEGDEFLPVALGGKPNIRRWLRKDHPGALRAKAAAPAAAQKKPVKRPQVKFIGSDDEDELPSMPSTTTAAAAAADDFVAVGPTRRQQQQQQRRLAAEKAIADERAAAEAPITVDAIEKKLREVLEARGRKGTDKSEQVATLRRLLSISETPVQRTHVQLVLIAVLYDAAQIVGGIMNAAAWSDAATEINSLLTLLEEHPNIVVREDVVEGEVPSWQQPLDGPVRIRGSIIAYLDRLEDEFTRALQQTDPHSADYLDRLRSHPILYALVVRCIAYFERTGHTSSLTRAILTRLEQVYYKSSALTASLEAAASALIPASAFTSGLKTDLPVPERIPAVVSQSTAAEPTALVHALCAFLYKQADPQQRTRAVLCHVYHHALHNRFATARDLLLMSHLQETIALADIPTQVLYNRAVVQLGLCAFRAGRFQDAASCLQELSATGRVRELLAQGISRTIVPGQPAATPEEERLERLRQLPFHMHINVELIECVALVCAVLLEIPVYARTATQPQAQQQQHQSQQQGIAQAGATMLLPSDARRMMLSKTLRRLLDSSARQPFLAPADSTREHIVAAAHALASGDWQVCAEHIHAIRVWDLLFATLSAEDVAVVKARLTAQIKDSALRTYLFLGSADYDSFGIADLGSMFDLSRRDVLRVVSELVYTRQIAGAIDYAASSVVGDVNGEVFVCHRKGAISKLQTIAFTLSDKCAWMAEQNAKMFENRFPNGDADDHADKDKEDGAADETRGSQARRQGGGRDGGDSNRRRTQQGGSDSTRTGGDGQRGSGGSGGGRGRGGNQQSGGRGRGQSKRGGPGGGGSKRQNNNNSAAPSTSA